MTSPRSSIARRNASQLSGRPLVNAITARSKDPGARAPKDKVSVLVDPAVRELVIGSALASNGLKPYGVDRSRCNQGIQAIIDTAAGKAASSADLPTARTLPLSEIGANGRAWFLIISRATTRRRKDGPASSSYEASPTFSDRHSQCVW